MLGVAAVMTASQRGNARVKRLIAASSAAALCAGCALTDKIELPSLAPEPPEAWATQVDAAAPPRGDWLGAFNDPALRELVIEALTANYDIAAAAARYEQAIATARATGAARLPSIDAVLSGDRAETVIDGATPINVSSDGLGLALSASWEADLWGRLADQARAGRLDAEAGLADLADARLSIAGAISRAWYDLVRAGLLADLAADEVATQERSLRLTRRRFEAGISSALDVRLARSALATAQASQVDADNAVNVSARRLETLLGRYPRAAIAAAEDLPVLSSLAGAGAPGELLARRPDLRAAEARLYAAGLRSEAAREALLPRLTLTARGGTSGDAAGELFDPDYLVSSIAGSLLQPIFRGGALRAEVERSDAVARERLASYAAIAVAAYEEAENALDADLALNIQEEALAVAAAEAIAAEAIAEREYAQGIGSIFDLLNAQSRRISAERQLITTRARRVDNRVQLYLAIGGDFLVDLEPRSGVAADNAPGE